MGNHYDSCRDGYNTFREWGNPPKDNTLIPEQTLDDRITLLKNALAALEQQKEDSAWPKPYTFYLHANEDKMLEAGYDLNLSEDVMETFIRTGYEIEFEGTVSLNGVFTCVSINGVKLVTPVAL